MVHASMAAPSRVSRLVDKLRQKGLFYTITHGFKYIVHRTYFRASDFYRNRYAVPRRARAATACLGGRRGLFLDCGSNIGQGFEYFRQHFTADHFDYELFEPNPNCLPYLERARACLPDHHIEIHNAAVSATMGHSRSMAWPNRRVESFPKAAQF